MITGAVLGLSARSLTITPSEATHLVQPNSFGEHKHLLSITTPRAEDYCVKVQFFVNADDALVKVSGSLSSADGWSSVRPGLIEFVQYPMYCAPETDPNYGDIETRFFAEDSTEAECGTPALGEFRSCLAYFDYNFNPLTGHSEPLRSTVFLHFVHMNQECPSTIPCWQHIINHETGHVLGLADPPALGEPDYGLYCAPLSVMHNIAYGCNNNFSWPTVDDKLSVFNSIPPTGSGDFGKGPL